MIDTDKYEGHDTDKRMKLLFRDSLLHIGNELSDADYHLLVDAPLLLEEVKRLRDLCDGLYTYAGSVEHESIIESFDGSPLTLAHFQKEMTWVNWRAKEWIKALDSIAEKMNGDEEE